MQRLLLGAMLALSSAAPSLEAQVKSTQISRDLRAKIDAAAARVLKETGVPSAEVGLVLNGAIAYTAAYGDARLNPLQRATAEMKYPVGSISKQFTAAAVLLLQQDGKLTLDDPVSRWFPELTRASEVTLRELLSHTSGYEDMRRRTTPSRFGFSLRTPFSWFTSGLKSRSTLRPGPNGSTATPTMWWPR